MRKYIIYNITIGFIIMIFVGWGATVAAYDFHSAEESGIASHLFLSTNDDEGRLDNASGSAITGKGYCIPGFKENRPEKIDTFSEGEKGIANHLIVSDAASGSNLNEMNKTAPYGKLCIMTAPDEMRFNNGDTYSWGETGGIN